MRSKFSHRLVESVRCLSLALAVMGCAIASGGCARQSAATGLPLRPDLSSFPGALGPAIAEAEEGVRRAPTEAGAWLKLGMLYHANGFLAEARACLLERSDDPRVGARASYFLALAAEFSGDLPEEERWLRQTLRLAPTYAPAHLLLAEVRYKAGDPAAAIASYEAVLHHVPDNVEAQIGLARERLRQGDEAGASAILDALTARSPGLSTALALRAQIAERRGDSAGAVALRRQARLRKDPPRTDPWSDEALAYCFDVQRLEMRYEDCVKSSRSDQALACLQRLEKVDPNHWQVCQMRALAAMQQGRSADAVREYERALAAGVDPAKVYPVLVSCLVSQQRFAEAEARAQAGLERAPRSAELLAALGGLRWQKRDQAAAERLLDEALRIDSRCLAAHRALARVQWDTGHKAQAIEHLEAVRASDPTDLACRGMLGEYLVENQRPAEAIEPLAEAREIAPDNEPVRQLLALAQVRTGNQLARQARNSEALTAYDAAIAVRPATAEAHANKVQLLLRQREVARADVALQAWLAIQPEEPAAWVMLGDVQHAAGQMEASRQSWTRAQTLLAAKPDPVLQQLVAQRLH